MNYENNFASRLIGARNRAGLSQTALADAVGVSLRTVQNWEASGSTAPKWESLRRLAAATGVTVAFLTDQEDESPEPLREDTSPEEMKVLDELRSLPDKERQQAISAIRSILSMIPKAEVSYRQKELRRALKSARDAARRAELRHKKDD